MVAPGRSPVIALALTGLLDSATGALLPSPLSIVTGQTDQTAKKGDSILAKRHERLEHTPNRAAASTEPVVSNVCFHVG